MSYFGFVNFVSNIPYYLDLFSFVERVVAHDIWALKRLSAVAYKGFTVILHFDIFFSS